MITICESNNPAKMSSTASIINSGLADNVLVIQSRAFPLGSRVCHGSLHVQELKKSGNCSDLAAFFIFKVQSSHASRSA